MKIVRETRTCGGETKEGKVQEGVKGIERKSKTSKQRNRRK